MWYNPSTWKVTNNIQDSIKNIRFSPTGHTGFAGSGFSSTPSQNRQSIVSKPATAPASNPIPDYTGGQVYNQGTVYSGGGGAVGPSPEEIQLQNYRGDATNRLRSILSAYDALFGGVDATVRDKTDQLNQSYDTQTQNLNKSFETGQGQTGSAYAARGLGQSSFLGDALGQNADIYNQNTTQLVNDRNNSLADLGRYAATTKAGFNAQKENYNNILGQVGNYDTQSLMALIPQLQQAYGNVQQQQAGLGTDSSFIQGLNSITPVQNRGADQLKTKLDALVASGAPMFAKNQIAGGVIKQAGLQDPSQRSYWENYWSQLQGQ